MMSCLSLLGLVYTEWFLGLKRSIPRYTERVRLQNWQFDGNPPDQRCHLLGKIMGTERQCVTWARCNG